MTDRVKLSRVYAVIEDLDYPITRNEAAIQLEEYTLTYADGEENLGGLVSETASDSFASPDELESELYGVLPIEAGGERGESEGEG